MKFLLLFLLSLASCSGYRFSRIENPLAQYNINSLSVPMFYNYSNLPNVSADFTRETYKLLMGFSGLKLYSGYRSEADAVLICLVRSPEKLAETLRTKNLILAQKRSANALGKTRRDFYVPGTTSVQLTVQVILIKKPSDEEIRLIAENYDPSASYASKVILNEFVQVVSQFSREVFDKNEGAEVIATQNSGILRKTTLSMSEQAATSIRDTILYAF